MIRIITGTPGAGKTNLALSLAVAQAKSENRVLWVHGVRGLRLDRIPCEVRVLENPELWFEAPDGAIFLLDEAQQTFRARPMGAPVPPYVAELETHRHRAFDFYLTTQDPGILDHQVRRLAGSHLHLRALPVSGYTSLYEYDSVQPKPTEWKTKKGALSVRKHKRPVHVFDWYESTVEVTAGHKPRMPSGAWWRIALPAAVIAFAAFLVLQPSSLLGSLFFGDDVASADLPPLSSAPHPSPSGLVRNGDINSLLDRSHSGPADRELMTAEEFARLHTPLVPGMPHSSPFYAQTFEARTFPRPLCVIVHSAAGDLDECFCLSQQATRLDIPLQVCVSYATNGFFDPTREDNRTAARREG